MTPLAKALIAVALVVPLVAYVAGTLAGAGADVPERQGTVYISDVEPASEDTTSTPDPSPGSTPKPSPSRPSPTGDNQPTPSQGEDGPADAPDTNEARVVTPPPVEDDDERDDDDDDDGDDGDDTDD